MLLEDEKLSKMVPFRIHERGQPDRNRLRKLEQYKGPDLDTVALLNDHHSKWSDEPARFWTHSSLRTPVSSDPQAQIVGLYPQTNRDDA